VISKSERKAEETGRAQGFHILKLTFCMIL
jgi:hypothetical protein